MIAEKDSALLVIGPGGSGKTSSLLIPNALLAPGALFATSSRADIYGATARARARIGRVWHFSAYNTKLPGAQEVRFSPLQGCEDETMADKIALRLASFVDRSEYAQQTSHKGHLHFRNHAHAVLFALMFIAANTDQPEGMGWVYRFVTSPAFTKALVTLARDLESHPEAAKLKSAIEVLAWIGSISAEERGSALSTAAHAVSAYRDPEVVKRSINGSFDFDAFVRGEPEKAIKGAEGFDNGVLGHHGLFPPMRGSWDSLYVCDASAESPAAVIYAEFEYRVREAAYKLSLEREIAGLSAPMPVTVIQDEGAVAPPFALSNFLAEHRGRSVLYAMGIQSMSQAKMLWPGIGADFLTLFRTAAVFRGIKDKETLELLSMLSGHYWQDVTNRTVTQGKDRSEGTSTGPQLVEQLRPAQIATGHKYWPDAALILNSLARTYWVRTTSYFAGEPWPRLLIRHLARSIDSETLLPLPRFDADSLERLGLTQANERLHIQFEQYSGGTR